MVKQMSVPTALSEATQLCICSFVKIASFHSSYWIFYRICNGLLRLPNLSFSHNIRMCCWRCFCWQFLLIFLPSLCYLKRTIDVCSVRLCQAVETVSASLALLVLTFRCVFAFLFPYGYQCNANVCAFGCVHGFSYAGVPCLQTDSYIWFELGVAL